MSGSQERLFSHLVSPNTKQVDNKRSSIDLSALKQIIWEHRKKTSTRNHQQNVGGAVMLEPTTFSNTVCLHGRQARPWRASDTGSNERVTCLNRNVRRSNKLILHRVSRLHEGTRPINDNSAGARRQVKFRNPTLGVRTFTVGGWLFPPIPLLTKLVSRDRSFKSPVLQLAG